MGKIAVIDSGLGGLTVLSELLKSMPNADYVYFGDNKNLPYGNKSKSDLFFLLNKNLSFLNSFGVEAIVFACNTLTVNFLYDLKGILNVKLFGVYPPVEYALTKYKNPLLIATESTVNYVRSRIKKINALALPSLAEDIENNFTDLNKVALADHLQNLNRFEYDAVILGCTHYPIIRQKFARFFPNADILDGGTFTAMSVARSLRGEKCCVGKVVFAGDYAKKNEFFYNYIKNN